ncbi:2-Methylisocitrate lyase, PEP mutase family [Asanoa hainanensis]|uniref:2-Methylisocitrate lyase, PEP mutase family n=2 Tax=Asanoa hainanensis TaxID=560556 RepID=A0A239NZX6_9ACTN|nr:2-Methylisocitrate lyase, PEP mutase family [Asanoa hainanensis]
MIAGGRSSHDERRPPETATHEQPRLADGDRADSNATAGNAPGSNPESRQERRVPVTSRRHVQNKVAGGETPTAGDRQKHDQEGRRPQKQDHAERGPQEYGLAEHQHRSGVDGVDVAPVPRAMLRDALISGDLVIAPGCYDVLGARVLEAAGLEAAYLTPFGFQAADAPSPHAPHDPWERYLDLARELVDASGLAIIVDGQTGLEGERSATERAADAFSAGAAGFVIEDRQGFGKDRPLRTMVEVGREIAAVRHEVGRETTVIVRTDAVRESVDDARARCESYLDAGADLVLPLMTRYLNYPDTPADRERRMSAYHFLTERVPARRIVVHSPTGRHLPVDEARRLGFGLYLMSQLLIASAVTGMTHELAAALADEPGPMPLLTPVDLATLTRVDRWLENRW